MTWWCSHCYVNVYQRVNSHQIPLSNHKITIKSHEVTVEPPWKITIKLTIVSHSSTIWRHQSLLSTPQKKSFVLRSTMGSAFACRPAGSRSVAPGGSCSRARCSGSARSAGAARRRGDRWKWRKLSTWGWKNGEFMMFNDDIWWYMMVYNLIVI